MDRGESEYAQPDQWSVATYTTQDPRSAPISSNITPQPDNVVTPSSARSSGLPSEHPRYSRYQAPHYLDAAGTMAQPNLSVSQVSPNYPPYSPHPQGQDMQYSYHPQHPPYMQQRSPYEQWSGYAPRQGMPGPYFQSGPGVQDQPQTSPSSRSGQAYTFVPIPGAQQHKRSRRRYEEIERIYKCGWNGCEKKYGTLNHLNAHVTMQAHGTKRNPEEFRGIRQEWKARKKEEENARKAEEERQRAAAQATQVDSPPADALQVPRQVYQQNDVRPSLPLISHQSADSHGQGQYGQPQAGMLYHHGTGQMGSYHNYPNSPYAQQGQAHALFA